MNSQSDYISVYFTTISLMFLKINVYILYYQCNAGIENWYPFEVTKSSYWLFMNKSGPYNSCLRS